MAVDAAVLSSGVVNSCDRSYNQGSSGKFYRINGRRGNPGNYGTVGALFEGFDHHFVVVGLGSNNSDSKSPKGSFELSVKP